MWIISKFGILNTNNVVKLNFEDGWTQAACVDGNTYYICPRPVVGDMLAFLSTHPCAVLRNRAEPR